MKLIIGLGNPGERYKKTRHNTGFMVIDSLLEKLEINHENPRTHTKHNAEIITADSLILAKPSTYMNNSGAAVASIAGFYKIPAKDIFVVHDDIALPLQTIRIRRGGSSGGHNGVQSIIDALGTPAFPRFRLGIGPLPARQSAENFVLKPFSKKELPLLKEVINTMTAALIFAFDHSLEQTMNAYNDS